MSDTPTPDQEAAYAAWRFMYYVAKKDMTYREIDAAVNRGEITPPEMP